VTPTYSSPGTSQSELFLLLIGSGLSFETPPVGNEHRQDDSASCGEQRNGQVARTNPRKETSRPVQIQEKVDASERAQDERFLQPQAVQRRHRHRRQAEGNRQVPQRSEKKHADRSERGIAEDAVIPPPQVPQRHREVQDLHANGKITILLLPSLVVLKDHIHKEKPPMMPDSGEIKLVMKKLVDSSP